MMKTNRNLNEVNFSNLTITEAVLILDRNSNTKKLADWLCELGETRKVVYNIKLEIAKVAR